MKSWEIGDIDIFYGFTLRMNLELNSKKNRRKVLKIKEYQERTNWYEKVIFAQSKVQDYFLRECK